MSINNGPLICPISFEMLKDTGWYGVDGEFDLCDTIYENQSVTLIFIFFNFRVIKYYVKIINMDLNIQNIVVKIKNGSLLNKEMILMKIIK